MAMMKTPSKGPEVADVTNMEDSITPSNSPTPKLMPMMISAITTARILIAYSCCWSFMSFMKGLTKSSNVTVARELRMDTFKLKERKKFIIYVVIYSLHNMGKEENHDGLEKQQKIIKLQFVWATSYYLFNRFIFTSKGFIKTSGTLCKMSKTTNFA